MNIRPAQPADTADWLRMRNVLWPSDDHASEIEEYFASGPSVLLAIVLVAERSSGGLAGFIEVGLRTYAEGCESSPVPFIEGWYVDTDARRSGIGTALVRHVEEWARGQGFTEIASDVEIENDVSIASHQDRKSTRLNSSHIL